MTRIRLVGPEQRYSAHGRRQGREIIAKLMAATPTNATLPQDLASLRTYSGCCAVSRVGIA